MQILKESKEQLPISFLTDFVSRGWDQIGQLKETVAVIKNEFSGTKKVEEILQPLIDAYLVCVGQFELHMQNKDYIEMPAEAELKEALAVKEDAEKIQVVVKQLDIEKEEDLKGLVLIPEPLAQEFTDEELEDEEFEDDELGTKEADQEVTSFFCDFEEPQEKQVEDFELY